MASSGAVPGGGGPARGPAYKFVRGERPVNPRTVRGGIKLTRDEAEIREHWLAARWLGLVSAGASAGAMREGLEYATAGQTRQLHFEPGRVIASVQGRDPRAYSTTISVPRFTDEQWDAAARALAEQAMFAAKLLAGSMPEAVGESLEDVSLGVLPPSVEQLSVRCSCREDDKPWCKHACCAALLVADRLITEPLLIFTLRGLDGQKFLERLREQRAFLGGTRTSSSVYAPRIPHVVDLTIRPLAERADGFWDMDPSLEGLDLPVVPPEVSHPLLRRLGTSPFEGARFPLVGLLATCYEVVSESVLREERGEEDADGDDSPDAQP